MGHRRAYHFRIHLGRKARATASCAPSSRSATRSSRSFRSRARRRANSTHAAGSLKQKFEDAGLKFDPVSFTYSFRSGPAILQSVDHVFRDEAIYRSIHARDRLSAPRFARRCRAEPDRALGIAAAGRASRTSRAGARRSTACRMTSPEVKLARRIQAEIRRLVESGTMTGTTGKRRRLRYGDMLVLVRRRGNAFRCGDPGAEARRHSRGRRRPAETDRAHRDHRPDESRRRAAAAAGRSGARGGAEEPAVRPHRGRAVRAGLAAQGIAARGADRITPRQTASSGMRSTGSKNASAAFAPRRRLPSMPGCSAATAAARASCGGSGMRPTTRSTNSSNSRWAMSARRRPRCRALWPGCARPTPR